MTLRCFTGGFKVSAPLMARFPELAERLNRIIYDQQMRRMTPEEIETAKQWSFALIRREHPEWTEEEVNRFYDNLINVKITVVDGWAQRNM